MAPDESSAMTISSSTAAEEEYDHDTDESYDHQQHPLNLSRLSVCTSSMNTTEDDDYQDCDGMRMFLSRLSIESFDADEELSDGKEDSALLDLSSDSEPGCYSLPATPPRRRKAGVVASNQSRGKDYASENDSGKSSNMRKNSRRRRRRRAVRERRMIDGEIEKTNRKELEDQSMGNSNYYCNSFSGESEGSGLMVITRPKGGRRPLCMDLDEVKACRDLGFELEHERMLEFPLRVSFNSRSSVDNNTSSGGNSPIANWRISSPGDDPREVKARLKVWAQAVALASASRHGCF